MNWTFLSTFHSSPQAFGLKMRFSMNTPPPSPTKTMIEFTVSGQYQSKFPAFLPFQPISVRSPPPPMALRSRPRPFLA